MRDTEQGYLFKCLLARHSWGFLSHFSYALLTAIHSRFSQFLSIAANSAKPILQWLKNADFVLYINEGDKLGLWPAQNHSSANEGENMRTQFPICNRKPERAPQIGGHTFFLCWRCFGIFLGIFALSPMFIFNKSSMDSLVIAGSLLWLPCFIDGMLQKYSTYTSTNFRRFVSGFLCGVSLLCIARLTVQQVQHLAFIEPRIWPCA